RARGWSRWRHGGSFGRGLRRDRPLAPSGARVSTRLAWRDGERTRVVEIVAEGDGRYRVTVDGVESTLNAEPLADGRLRIESESGTTFAEITALGPRRFVRLGTLDFVLAREAGTPRRAA